MNILVINAGSSSLKYQLIDSSAETVIAKGLVERIGMDGSNLKHTPAGRDAVRITFPMENHVSAIKAVLNALINSQYGVIKSMDEIQAVGHRVVHGGEDFASSALIDDSVIDAIEKNIELAPLHNPANLMGISACREVMPTVPMVAVFDTAFHQTMPREAFLYGLPYEYYERYKGRRYGFHGTSHFYVSRRAAQMMEKPVEEQHVRFSFDARRRSGEEALEVRELSKSFEGQPVFQNLSFKLRTGDRVALIGPNGVGKSTLFRILTHQINPDHGSVRFGTNIDIGYYDQHQQNLNPQNTILDEVWNAFPKLEQTRIRSALGLFLFTGDEVFEKIEKLSGGERGRVALTKLMLKQDNLLLLDEPTNHLDMDSREVLEDALRDFPGTILAISHDRYFINRFAEKVMVMEKDGVTEYLGNFDDYIEKRDRPRPPVSSLEDEPTRTAQTREKKKTRQQNALLRELKAAVDKAEAAIEQNEREMARLEAELARPETYNDLEAMRRLTESYQAEQDKTESLYEALEAAETALSEASEN